MHYAKMPGTIAGKQGRGQAKGGKEKHQKKTIRCPGVIEGDQLSYIQIKKGHVLIQRVPPEGTKQIKGEKDQKLKRARAPSRTLAPRDERVKKGMRD